MKNFLIIANDKYVQYAKALIVSIYFFERGSKIFLYVVNPSDKSIRELEEKKDVYNLHLNFEYKNFSEYCTEERTVDRCEAAYSANIRAKHLHALVANHDIDNITYIDADSLLRNSLYNMHYQDFDISFYIKGDDHFIEELGPQCPSQVFQTKSGIISLTLSEDRAILLECLEFFIEKIEEFNVCKWYADQVALKQLYYNFIVNGKLKFAPITSTYFDWRCKDNTNIWIGKGELKENNEEFIKIQNLYRDLF